MFQDVDQAQAEAIEGRAQQIGREIFRRLDQHLPRIYHSRWWDERLMGWAMRDSALKTQLFRFVDVLPTLHTSREVVGHLEEYLTEAQPRGVVGWIAAAAESAGQSRLASRVMAAAARQHAQHNARRFIAGSTPQEMLESAKELRREGCGFTVDILGEAVISEAEADRHAQAYQQLLHQLSDTVAGWPEDPRIDRGAYGRPARVNLSVKLSALYSQMDAIDPDRAVEAVGRRLRPLLRTARSLQAYIHVDMEAYATKDLTLHIFQRIMEEDEFRDWEQVGIVVQCYLKDAGSDLMRLREWAQRRGTPVWIRLVKGAYWDYETAHAIAQGWPVPVFQQKSATDANFERQTRFLLANYRHLRPALGTHNIRSMAYALAAAEQLELPDRGVELQMLYGMAEAERRVLVEMGHPVRVYMPYGELIPGMAYLVRRLLENTSNDSFLRSAYVEGAELDELLAAPDERAAAAPDERAAAAPDERAAAAPHSPKSLAFPSPSFPEKPAMTRPVEFPPPYRNFPPVDFSRSENREAMQRALAEVRDAFGRNCPLVIGGKSVESPDVADSINPSHTDQIVGRVHMARPEHVQQAVSIAASALGPWADDGVDQRAELLERIAGRMQQRLFELAAWQVYECGKPWREATNDVGEAIDFCRYYAQGARALFAAAGADVPGEQNRWEYLPRGVTVVIAPWNFPLAIITGMMSAALVTGNPVIMKPAEQSSVIAHLLMEVCQEAGAPAGVLQYLPGRGEDIGPLLVQDPQVATIAFTGSRQVGLTINAQAAEASRSGSQHVKRVIAEMGGKNAIIVDQDADLDEAIQGIVYSAFGYQGQKCSACSRLIPVGQVYGPLLERLIEAARSLIVAPAEDPSTFLGPLIDREAYDKVRAYIAIGRQEGQHVLDVETGSLADHGYFIGPQIFADVSPKARLAQEEIFGPVLAVLRADDLDHAIAIANSTPYALTGGIYSRSPAHLDEAARRMMAGNVYLNRPITGALVGRQPFGGFRLSGVGSKAGGPDYLLQFVVPRAVTENTMRRGFAPETTT
jgi:RHH-type proline utilization regulon transcriptional repressor/proline dehydrogenase/delta 1-pyrroline-5-carboxylate dehydrogenase